MSPKKNARKTIWDASNGDSRLPMMNYAREHWGNALRCPIDPSIDWVQEAAAWNTDERSTL